MQKRAVQFTKKPYLPLFSSETADKFAKDYAIKKSFRHALHLVTAHLHRQNQVAHALRTRDFWLASLSMHFPIHFGWRAHEYPITLRLRDPCARIYTRTVYLIKRYFIVFLSPKIKPCDPTWTWKTVLK